VSQPQQRIHLVGIGGSGMSPLAEVLHARGHRVSGSDLVGSGVTQRLASLGMRICLGHDAANLGDAQVLVTSTAVQPDNPELLAARVKGLPIWGRAQMLAELMQGQFSIAVTGTHGKTTTTALVSAVLAEAGLDPTTLVGGALQANGSHVRLGASQTMVVEADESDASFLHLNPTLAVLTNIDADHMDTFGQSLQRLQDAFVDFVHRLPESGQVVLCSDDAGVQQILPRLQRTVVSYGLGPQASLRGTDLQALPGGGMRFVACQPGHPDLPLQLALSGEHNVRNALAAIAVLRLLSKQLQQPQQPQPESGGAAALLATEADTDAASQRALLGFTGVGRRFESHGEWPCAHGGSFLLIDDYGHHPVELAAVIQAARGAFGQRRLQVVFQPHRYSRTRDCFADFVQVLSKADAVLLTEVYPAGEAAIAGADAQALAQSLQAAGTPTHLVPVLADLPAALQRLARAGDVVVSLGAGSIGSLPQRLRQFRQQSLQPQGAAQGLRSKVVEAPQSSAAADESGVAA